MREIKFRAWHKTEKKMDEVTELCTWRRLVYVSKEELSWTFSEIELMQFTGLLDKNGKEIYEGDIVRIEDEGICQIVWGKFSDCCVHGETWMLQPQIWEPTIYYHHEEAEVIGNVYENGELLERARE